MRFRSTNFLDQARGKGGVIMEGDGELSLPPIQQPICIAGSQIPSAQVPSLTDPQTRSFIADNGGSVKAGGAVAASSNKIATLGSGLWHIYYSGIATFIGTDNVGNRTTFTLTDAAASPLQASLFRMDHLAAGAAVRVAFQGSFFLSIGEDGWFFSVEIGALVALDAVSMQACVIGTKLI